MFWIRSALKCIGKCGAASRIMFKSLESRLRSSSIVMLCSVSSKIAFFSVSTSSNVYDCGSKIVSLN